MGSKSIYLEKAFLNACYGGASMPTPPGTWYIALFTVNPTEGTDAATEASGGSYARAAVTNNATNFPNATQSGLNPAQKTNALDIPYTTATGAWGTLTGFGMYDASSGGNLWHWGEVTPNTPIISGSPFTIYAGLLTITET